MASASERGKSNQRKGGYHEQKYGKALNELTGLTFKRNFKQRIQAEHLGDLLCDDADFPFQPSKPSLKPPTPANNSTTLSFALVAIYIE